MGNQLKFKKDLLKFSTSLNAEFKETVKKVAVDIFVDIVLTSPVDLGAYRASHQIAMNTPSEKVIKPEKGQKFQKRGSTTRAMKQLNNLKKYDLNDVIWISNNLPYASVLEFGDGTKRKVYGTYGKAIQKAEDTIQSALDKL